MSAPETVQLLVKRTKARRGRVGLTCGVFDLLHVNHIRFFTETAIYVDTLIVAVNSDRTVRLLKGENRPVVPEQERAEVVQGLRFVDCAFVFDDLDPCQIIEDLQPHFFFKGKDREGTEIPEANVIAAYGGELRFIGPPKDHSSSALIAAL